VLESTPGFSTEIPKFSPKTNRRIWSNIPDQIAIARALKYAANLHRLAIKIHNDGILRF